MLTIHNLENVKCHGHLSSHNIFVDLKKVESGTFEVSIRISDFENMDFMEYGNMFYNYRMSSVWSAPEVLKAPKKIPELSSHLDTYSFGMIIWELWHMSIPFDNDIKSAEEYVVKEESRPKIIRGAEDIDDDFDQRQEEMNDEQFFTAKSEPN